MIISKCEKIDKISFYNIYYKMTDRYIELFIDSVKKSEFKDAMLILEQIPDRVLERDMHDYDYRRILYRGRSLTNYYTDRNVDTMIQNNNLFYYIMKYPDANLIGKYIERISSNINFENEFQTELFNETLVSLVMASFMYNIASEQLLDAFFDVFGVDTFMLLYQAHERFSPEFADTMVLFNNYFSVGRIRRLFDKLDVSSKDYERLFHYIEPISGVSYEEYMKYIEITQEYNLLPDSVAKLIGDYIRKD